MSQSMERWARRVALALSFTTLVLAGEARDAQANPVAQALFDDAKKLMAAGKYAEACPKLEESQRLDPGMGTQFNLATCYEEVGRTATAWALFLDVAGSAKAAGQADREKVARQRAALLEPKLIRLSIAVPEGAPSDVSVKRDGVEVGKAQWGTPVPVDPGKHEIVATAAGKQAFQANVELATPGATETVTITFDAPASVRPGPTPDKGTKPVGPPDNQPATRRKSTAMMVTGIGLISLGAIAGVSGAVIVGVCRDGAPNRPAECDKNSVPGGVGLLLGGVVGLGVGIPLTIVGSAKVPVEPKSSAAPALLLGPGSAAVRWTF